ncbi:hypothetical protein jaqu_23510 [Jannaschia aquimarina]|uniref:Uncharacterized protein n=1 Tax=Jannaschia aquimarina TaxID=935700 RepID=A0A0D1EED9_9RHOB|nr:hypothetical protein jaqu_23510 [Jannaschia aquimarina]SNT01849.1 hypothetical protein SAMN05421775_104262 [Jannaschia aquimarina]
MPSGQALVLWEILWEKVEGQEDVQAVLRFIAPGVAREGGTVDAEAAMLDMDWLCETHAMPLASMSYARSDMVIVNLMDRPVARGETDPNATQYFGVYRIADGGCLPEDG